MWSIFSRLATKPGFLWAPTTAPVRKSLFDWTSDTRGFKVVSSLRRRCRSCRIVRRGKKTYVLCTENPRHKQRNGKGGSRYSKC